jgi:hypothetical protein
MFPMESEPQMTWVTEELRRAVKVSSKKQYRLAADCRMHPSLLSSVLNHRRQVPVGDWRIVRLARLVGLHSSRAFENGPQLRLVPPAGGSAPPPDSSIDGDDSTA